MNYHVHAACDLPTRPSKKVGRWQESYLDTHDWQLFRKGLWLEERETPAGERSLRLMDANDVGECLRVDHFDLGELKTRFNIELERCTSRLVVYDVTRVYTDSGHIDLIIDRGESNKAFCVQTFVYEHPRDVKPVERPSPSRLMTVLLVSPLTLRLLPKFEIPPIRGNAITPPIWAHDTGFVDYFEVLERKDVTKDILTTASTLFSENYGVWGGGPRLGQPVRLSPERLAKLCLFDEDCFLVRAVNEKNEVLGHAFGRRFPHQNESVVWITQLVVRRDSRERGIATGMIAMVKGPICGLISSNPYAIFALERATGKVCSRELISKAGSIVAMVTPNKFDEERCVVANEFYVRHEVQHDLIEFGKLGEGEEFVAIVF